MEKLTLWAERMCRHFDWQKYFAKDKGTKEAAALLYVREDTVQKLNQIYYERITIFVAAVFIEFLLALICIFSNPLGSVKEGYFLERGEEEVKQELLVSMEGKNGTSELGEDNKMMFLIEVKDLSDNEKKELSGRVKTYLEQSIKGKNKSLFIVSERLYLPKKIPETEVTIDWTMNELYLTAEGRLKSKNIPDDGVETVLEAKAHFRNWEEKFSFPVFLMPKVLTSREKMLEAVKKGIQRSIREQNTKAVVELPKEVGEIALAYKDTNEKKDYTPVLLSSIVLVLLPFLWREQQKKKLLAREKELLLDHSGFLHQIILLLGAGLTVRSALERLVAEYEERLKNGKVRRYIYEELWVTCNQMKNGVSEERALDEFGKRCKLLVYLRFSAIISQNIRKGAQGLLPLLEEDALESFQRRKETVKRLGEEAGTKMLFPMMLMLVIVMGIIMIPAFMTL